MITELKFDVHETDHNQRNCFHVAAMCEHSGNIDMMRFLHSIDNTLCRAKDAHGLTTWIICINAQSRLKVEFLLNLPFPDGPETVFDNELCVICFDEKPNLVFLPCKHKCVCKNCMMASFKDFEKCPICKEDIEMVFNFE